VGEQAQLDRADAKIIEGGVLITDSKLIKRLLPIDWGGPRVRLRAIAGSVRMAPS